MEDEDIEEGQIVSHQQPRSRGRARIPERWTRMISIFGDDLSQVKCYELATDLLVDNAMDKAPTKKRNEAEWKPLFWPKEFTISDHDHTLAGNKLSAAKLRIYGK